MYEIKLVRKAQKFYEKCNDQIVVRLNQAFEKISEQPFKGANIKKLSDYFKGSYRCNLGKLRIIYSIDKENQIVFIEVIDYRGDVYKD